MLNNSPIILTFLALNRSVIVGESLLIYIYMCVCVFSILRRDEKIQFSTENA